MSTKTEKTILLSDMIRFRKSKEALDDLFDSMLEKPLSDNIIDNCL